MPVVDLAGIRPSLGSAVDKQKHSELPVWSPEATGFACGTYSDQIPLIGPPGWQSFPMRTKFASYLLFLHSSRIKSMSVIATLRVRLRWPVRHFSPATMGNGTQLIVHPFLMPLSFHSAIRFRRPCAVAESQQQSH